MGWGFQKASVVAVQPVISGVCPLFQVEGERKKKEEKKTPSPHHLIFSRMSEEFHQHWHQHFSPHPLMSPPIQPPHFVVFDENVRGVPSPSVINSSWGNS